MVRVVTPYGAFHEPPYTDEEDEAFERRLRRGGDVKIVTKRKPTHREP